MTTIQGTVTSAKMQNTVTVTVHRNMLHPLYKKRFRVSKKFLADTDGKDVKVGDEVIITECRPLSKRKHFLVSEIVKKAVQTAEIKTDARVEQAMARGGKIASDEDTSSDSK